MTPAERRIFINQPSETSVRHDDLVLAAVLAAVAALGPPPYPRGDRPIWWRGEHPIREITSAGPGCTRCVLALPGGPLRRQRAAGPAAHLFPGRLFPSRRGRPPRPCHRL